MHPAKNLAAFAANDYLSEAVVAAEGSGFSVRAGVDDAQAPPIGTCGTVIGVDDIGSIMVDWDRGGSLNVVYREDLCEKIDE